MSTETLDRPVGAFVAENYKAAGIFQKYGIDFCCGGQQSLSAACAEQGVKLDTLLAELADLDGTGTEGAEFAAMPLDELIDHIMETHHEYILKAVPDIAAFANKVADRHGEYHPETIEIRAIFLNLANELQQHMFKEENILFPYIKRLVALSKSRQNLGASQFGTIRNPISMMEHEHDNAGEAMRRISALSNGYTPPEDACTSYRVLYKELEEFEKDLHLHIHKENNILHPRAIALEQEVL